MSAIDIASKIVKEFEGASLESYQDLGGIWTIGWGCTHGVSPGMRITREQAEERLSQDLLDTQTRVKAQIEVPLNDNQLAALISFTYNEGAQHLLESTVEKLLNAHNYAGAADAFLMWDKVRGKIVPGLIRRREAERSIFIS